MLRRTELAAFGPKRQVTGVGGIDTDTDGDGDEEENLMTSYRRSPSFVRVAPGCQLGDLTLRLKETWTLRRSAPSSARWGSRSLALRGERDPPSGSSDRP